MADDDTLEPTEFGLELKRRREEWGFSVRAAATRAGLGSHARWAQVEQGWQHTKNGKVPTKAGVDFVVKAAIALDWPFYEALELAGFDPDEVEIPEKPKDAPPRVLEDMWAKLTSQQRIMVYNMIRIMLDPEASFDTPGRNAQTRSVPRVVFSNDDEDADR